MKPSPENLGSEAQIAWRAFLDMKASKAAHFGLLEEIETRYQSGGAPSLAENLQLEKLLAEHDRNVLAFQTAMTAVSDADELRALVDLMS